MIALIVIWMTASTVCLAALFVEVIFLNRRFQRLLTIVEEMNEDVVYKPGHLRDRLKTAGRN